METETRAKKDRFGIPLFLPMPVFSDSDTLSLEDCGKAVDSQICSKPGITLWMEEETKDRREPNYLF
jgi:hypothetical protein